MRHSLTPSQLAALRAYAREHGRKWKAQLVKDYQNELLAGELQVILERAHLRKELDAYLSEVS